MPWRRFLVYNALGGICWATSVGVSGYVLGKGAEKVFASAGVAVGIAVVVAIGGLWGWTHLRRRRRAAAPGRAPAHRRRVIVRSASGGFGPSDPARHAGRCRAGRPVQCRRRAAAAVRARLHAAERRPLLPSPRPRLAGGELGRNAPGRRRHAAAHGRRPVPHHRAAPRLRAEQGVVRVHLARGRHRRRLPLQQHLLRPAGLRGGELPPPGFKALLRQGGSRHPRLRARLAPPRRPALRDARHPVPAPASSPTRGSPSRAPWA